MSAATIDRLWTIEDLMTRWSVGENVVRRHIKDDGVPFVPLGRTKGRRPQYRFRRLAIERWEAERERVHDKVEAPTETPKLPAGAAPIGWDGKIRTRRGQEVKDRRAKNIHPRADQ